MNLPITPAGRPIQRAGHIGDRDNRFCGAAVFGELAGQVREAIELLARACGLPALTAIDRDVVRMIALATASPDARVWPLKLARTLACYGNPYAGMYGAQLITRNEHIGPGVASAGAAALVWLRERAGDDADDAAIDAAVGEHLATRGRIGGFGVPMRPEDERLVALRVWMTGHPAAARPAWRLHERIIPAMRARESIEPNIAIALSALMLDLGLPPHRCGPFLSLVMNHTFAAHALEAAEQDGPWLQRLPLDAIDDRSAPPRRTPAAEAAAARSTGSTVPRRCLSW